MEAETWTTKDFIYDSSLVGLYCFMFFMEIESGDESEWR